MRGGAMNLPLHDLGVNDLAAIIHHRVLQNFNLAGFTLHFHYCDM